LATHKFFSTHLEHLLLIYKQGSTLKVVVGNSDIF